VVVQALRQEFFDTGMKMRAIDSMIVAQLMT
jgi:hypothetical protein